ncbi:MAG: DUF554 domain-containing protein [Spirochaetaceae bacterium]|nr:DUF554 domain-containing protein [Spirochaetaceae bacterium]
MIATFINCITVILGSLLGLLIKSHINKEFQDIVETSAGFVTLVIGIEMALKTGSAIVLLFALIIGGMLGTFLKIEDRIYGIGKKLDIRQKGNGEDESSFAKGFLNSSVLFCFGAMTILGSIQAGVNQDYDLLFLKSGLDGSMSIVLAATYGIGVMASALFILVFQGTITLLSSSLSHLLTSEGINEIGAIGGVMIVMIGFNLLKLKTLKVANFFPSIILAPIFISLVPFVSSIFNSII